MHASVALPDIAADISGAEAESHSDSDEEPNRNWGEPFNDKHYAALADKVDAEE